MSNSVTERYEALVAEGEVQHDPAQLTVAAALDDVASDLTTQAAAHEGGVTGFFRRRLGRTPRSVKGLYVWGEVGRGKTMLMDLFYETIEVEKKRRLHFNDFMADAHTRIAALRKTKVDDAVLKAADDLADEARVLCFDEFAVTDIADAMILARLFRQLFARGVTLVATSNVAPNDLYRDGLNRQLFVPFIHLLREYVDVVRLDADVDYRLDRLKDFRVWFAPGDQGFERLWATLLGDRTAAADDGEGRLAQPGGAARRRRSGALRFLRAGRGAAQCGRLHRPRQSLPHHLPGGHSGALPGTAGDDAALHQPRRRPL